MSIRALFVRGVAVGGFAIGSLVALGESPAAAGTLSLDPGEDLVDDQHVVMSGSGFRANTVYTVSQCHFYKGGCNDDRWSLATDSRGSFSATVVVKRYITNEWTAHDCAVAPGECQIRLTEPEYITHSIDLTFATPAPNPK